MRVSAFVASDGAALDVRNYPMNSSLSLVCTIYFPRNPPGCYAFTLGAIFSYDMVSADTQHQGVLEQLDAMTVTAGGTSSNSVVFDAPPFAADALLSTVREPDREEVEAWTTLAEVAKWAKLSGDIHWTTSKSGSLLRLLAGEDEDIDDLLIPCILRGSIRQMTPTGIWCFE